MRKYFIRHRPLKFSKFQLDFTLKNFSKYFCERFVQKFEIHLSTRNLFLVAITGIFIFGFIVYLFSENFLIALIFSIFGVFIVVPINDFLKNKKRRIVESQILEFLSLLNITLRAGLTIRNGLEICCKQIKSPLSEELRRVMDEINMDIDVSKALNNMARRLKISEMDLIVSAIEITAKVGGNVTEIFGSLINTIRERQNLKEEIRVFTTQGRFSGNIISLLPLGYFIIFYSFESEQVKLIFSKTLGVIIVLTGLLLNLIGYLVIRGITKPKIKNSEYNTNSSSKFAKKCLILFKKIQKKIKLRKIFRESLKSKNYKRFLIFYRSFYRDFDKDLVEMIIFIKVISILMAIIISIVYSNSIKSFILTSVVFGSVCFFIPDFYIKRKLIKESILIDKDLPNVIDKLNLGCKAGLNLRKSLYLVVNNTRSLLGRKLRKLVRDLKLGKPKQEAFNNLISKTESRELKSFIVALVQGERFGVPISEILENQAKDCRFRVHKREEMRARKIPILILFPLIFFILPGFLTIAMGTFVFSILNI